MHSLLILIKSQPHLNHWPHTATVCPTLQSLQLRLQPFSAQGLAWRRAELEDMLLRRAGSLWTQKHPNAQNTQGGSEAMPAFLYKSSWPQLTHAIKMDDTWGHDAKWNKPDTKGWIMYASTYMRYLEGSNSETDIAWVLAEARRKGKREIQAEWLWSFSFTLWRALEMEGGMDVQQCELLNRAFRNGWEGKLCVMHIEPYLNY
jgi:hypothetical protein